MSDTNPAIRDNSGGTVTIVYILYLAGLVIGITSVIAVVMAYVNRSAGPAWAESHYRFQIRTFWIGILYGFVGLILLFVLIGWIVLLFAMIWVIVRCVKGMRFASAAQPYPTPGAWLW
jgi:uncharacterized membrane protein